MEGYIIISGGKTLDYCKPLFNTFNKNRDNCIRNHVQEMEICWKELNAFGETA